MLKPVQIQHEAQGDTRVPNAKEKIRPQTSAVGPSAWPAETGAASPDDIHSRAMSVYQYVGNSLGAGPNGIHPPTFVCALGAIAGYAARHVVTMRTIRGQCDDDFDRVAVSPSTTLVVSNQVNDIVLSMDGNGVAGILVAAAMRCGHTALPDLNAMLQAHLEGLRNGAAPISDTGLDRHRPDVPAETLLMMYWESMARFFRDPENDLELSPLAAAAAAGEAISVYREKMPPAVSLDLALTTAISMSKVDRAF